MNLKPLWRWQYMSAVGTFTGTVRGVDPRDALSRMLTYCTADDQALFGEKHGIPVSVIDEAPGNSDRLFETAGDSWSIQLKMITCPDASRHEGDIVGCGSTDLTDPDEEGMVDCGSCGLFFNPATAY